MDFIFNLIALLALVAGILNLIAYSKFNVRNAPLTGIWHHLVVSASKVNLKIHWIVVAAVFLFWLLFVNMAFSLVFLFAGWARARLVKKIRAPYATT